MEEKYKLAFIKDDGIEYYGKTVSGSQHIMYLMEYIQKNYADKPIFRALLNSGVTDQVVFGLTYLEHMAILLNETKYDEEGNIKYGTFACLELPPVISEELEANLLSLASHLSQFTNLVFEVSFVDQDKHLDSRMIELDPNMDMEEKIKAAINDARGLSGAKKL